MRGRYPTVTDTISYKWDLRTIQGVTANVQVPENTTGKTIHYRWTYEPTWIYVAPLISTNDPVYKCWASDSYYLNSYELQTDKSGGYEKDLFFFPTIRNERTFKKLSVLVTQHAINEPYFSFWKEMKDRNEGSTLMDVPPYNLKTNFSSPTGGTNVSDYFGVSSEQAKKWYFNKDDLSYYYTWKIHCALIDWSFTGPRLRLKNALIAGHIHSERALLPNHSGGRININH